MTELRKILRIADVKPKGKSASSNADGRKDKEILKSFAQDEKEHLITPIYDSYLTKLNGKFIDWNGESSKRKSWGLHPSSINGCSRALQYSWLGVPRSQVITPKLSRIFAVGHYTHHRIQSDLERAGLLAFREVPLYYPKYCLIGNADGLLHWQFDDFYAILEIKSINPKDFASLVVPSENYIWQAQSYMLMAEYMRKQAHSDASLQGAVYDLLRKIKNPLHQVNFYYECKGTAQTKEIIVTRDKDIQQQIKEKAVTIVGAMKRKELLPREADGPTESPCNRCDYRSKCWDNFNSTQVDWSNIERRE